MTNMKKTLIALALSSLSLTAVAAEGWKFAPLFTEPGFKLDPTIAATVGSVKQQGGPTDTAYGVELNVNCGLIQSPDNRIRTHISLNRLTENTYDATLFELSPRYTVPLADGFSIGVGPSIGAARVDPSAAGVSGETLFAYGVVAGLNYRKGALYAGLDLGLRRTNDKNGIDFDSRGATLKVGFNF